MAYWMLVLTPTPTAASMDAVEVALYSDFEGYSNEDGDQITWEFIDRPGPSTLWWMALRDEHGGWLRFRMDLANAEHRDAFRAGKVPPGLRAEPVSRGR